MSATPAQELTLTSQSVLRVNMGLAVALIVAIMGAGGYVWRLDGRIAEAKTSIDVGNANLVEVRKAIDRSTEQLIANSRAVAILETVVSGLDRRVDSLEKARTR